MGPTLNVARFNPASCPRTLSRAPHHRSDLPAVGDTDAVGQHVVARGGLSPRFSVSPAGAERRGTARHAGSARSRARGAVRAEPCVRHGAGGTAPAARCVRAARAGACRTGGAAVWRECRPRRRLAPSPSAAAAIHCASGPRSCACPVRQARPWPVRWSPVRDDATMGSARHPFPDSAAQPRTETHGSLRRAVARPPRIGFARLAIRDHVRPCSSC